MAFLKAFGAYLPERIVTNQEMAAITGMEAGQIRAVSGIEERRFAALQESVADLAVHAAQDCLDRAGMTAGDLGMLIMASGSAERRFPGPAASVAHRLGLESTPALDLPIASAGSLFALSLASRVAAAHGNVLVIGAEKMSSVVLRPPIDRATAILFGDGAGACLVAPHAGMAEIVDSVLYSDGAFTEDLRLGFEGGLAMNGRSVILQASRKVPRAISALLARNGLGPAEVDVFLMHQANRNLLDGVARALGIAAERFYSNIRTFGNTSSASLLIAAAEWQRAGGFRAGVPVIFAAFGAGFHWGAMLAKG
jgi:3-oxoacyl-[acyl-carrier-protein] synthase III